MFDNIENRRSYLSKKLESRFKRMRTYARSPTRERSPTFRQLLHVETGGMSTRKRLVLKGGWMAWSDAARRAAILARRLKRVQRFEVKTSKQEDQKGYLTAKISGRLNRTLWEARRSGDTSPQVRRMLKSRTALIGKAPRIQRRGGY